MRIGGKVFTTLAICLCLVSFVAEPKQNGFHCDDPSIRQPYVELQIGLMKLLSFCVLIPIIAIILAENICKTLTKTPTKQLIRRNISVFMFGILVNFLSVMSAKNVFGRLRPHAIQFCNASHYCPKDLDNKYIEAFECYNSEVSVQMLKNVRHSFYSGHASLAVYSGVYLILYMRSKVKPQSIALTLMLSVVYIMIAMSSLYPGFTQWYNHWHFATDVITGYIIGLMSSIVIFKVFPKEEPTVQKNTNKYMPLNKLLTTALVTSL